jgi:hypothetical protein
VALSKLAAGKKNPRRVKPEREASGRLVASIKAIQSVYDPGFYGNGISFRSKGMRKSYWPIITWILSTMVLSSGRFKPKLRSAAVAVRMGVR